MTRLRDANRTEVVEHIDARRRRELAEQRSQQQAREQPSNSWDAWYAAIDRRIEQHFTAGEAGVFGVLIDALGKVISSERFDRRKEIKAAVEAAERTFKAKLMERLKSVAGQLPVAKIWRKKSVRYEAQLVSHDGALYQALRVTAQAPGGSDWIWRRTRRANTERLWTLRRL